MLEILETFAGACRLCLWRADKMINFLQGQENLSILSKIRSCLPIEIDLEDDLPKDICYECNYKLEIFSEFYQTCVRSDKILKHYSSQINKSYPQKHEIKLENSDDVEMSDETLTVRPESSIAYTSPTSVRTTSISADNELIDLNSPVSNTRSLMSPVPQISNNVRSNCIANAETLRINYSDDNNDIVLLNRVTEDISNCTGNVISETSQSTYLPSRMMNPLNSRPINNDCEIIEVESIPEEPVLSGNHDSFKTLANKIREHYEVKCSNFSKNGESNTECSSLNSVCKSQFCDDLPEPKVSGDLLMLFHPVTVKQEEIYKDKSSGNEVVEDCERTHSVQTSKEKGVIKKRRNFISVCGEEINMHVTSKNKKRNVIKEKSEHIDVKSKKEAICRKSRRKYLRKARNAIRIQLKKVSESKKGRIQQVKVKKTSKQFQRERKVGKVLLKDKHATCRYCSKKYSTLKWCLRHEKSHSEGITYKCNVCNSTFLTASQLKMHSCIELLVMQINNDHSYCGSGFEKAKGKMCQRCGEFFHTLASFSEHGQTCSVKRCRSRATSFKKENTVLNQEKNHGLPFKMIRATVKITEKATPLKKY